MMEPDVIQVIDFHKAYRETVAVTALSFDVQPGQVLGLLGPNGAGKTTTLRAIAGVIPPTHGRLLIGGHDVCAEPVAAKQLLAYVPDDPKLFDALTIWEHFQFIAAAYRVRDFQANAQALLDQFELTGKRDSLAQELSRGMRQKLAICCAYLHDPRAILFDEPLTGLDPHGIRTMKASVRQRASAGAAIVVSLAFARARAGSMHPPADSASRPAAVLWPGGRRQGGVRLRQRRCVVGGTILSRNGRLDRLAAKRRGACVGEERRVLLET